MCRAAADESFRVPAGFSVTQIAGDELAHDIFSLTIDPRGRIAVSGPGYIKLIHDDNGDGVADRASLFAALPRSGAQGMCFAGDELWATGDGGLLRFRDADRDGTADGPPDVVAKLRNPEHGAHAIRQGPDGWFYVVCGNDSGLGSEHVRSQFSPVAAPRCGGILRVSPDARLSEVVAHGFRNPYDLDFTPAGQLLTVDSDGERDQHLPWYEPTRMFDVAAGQEHGWLEGGWTKSWSRPEYFFDNVDRVCEFGRGSPTGLVVYRHRQFPLRYRGGAFAACWTFGRVYFVPLEADGSTVRGQPEIFAATTGENGFAPVDLAVGPAGELVVAIGGRKTRGGVYRIQYAGSDGETSPQADSAVAPLQAVLAADQPLASWSRATWLPLAQELGEQAFLDAVVNPQLSADERIRAVEILTERFGGVSPLLAAKLPAQDDPRLVARIAWGIARSIASGKLDTLARSDAERLFCQLSHHESPLVQRSAWEALTVVEPISLSPDWERALASGDRRVRAAMTARLAPLKRRAFGRWTANILEGTSSLSDAANLRAVCHEIAGPNRLKFLAGCVALFERARDPQVQLELLRCWQLGLGDIRIEGKGQLEFPGYTADRLAVIEEQREQYAARLSAEFPFTDARVNREAARTLAMLRAAPASTAEAIARLALAEPNSSGTLHYLFALSHIPGERTAVCTQLTADALAGLHAKLVGRGEYPSRNWTSIVQAGLAGLLEHDPQLASVLVEHPEFGRAQQVVFLAKLPADFQAAAGRRLFERAREAQSDEAWTPELITALRELPPAALSEQAVLAELRTHWDDFRLRDAIAFWLARGGNVTDRARLVEALGSPQQEVVEHSARALLEMPGPGTTAEVAAALTALRQASAGEPRLEAGAAGPRDSELELRLWRQGEPLRRRLDQLLRQWSGGDRRPNDSQTSYRDWFAWFRQQHPDEAEKISGAGIDEAAWAARLEAIDWGRAEARAGKSVFEKQGCHRCHTGDNRLGPDLAGAAQRMTRADLFAAIYDPQREVAPPYRTTLLATRAGQVHHGLIIYESPEGTLLQTTPDTTIRVTGDELLLAQPSARSLMPTGLLDPLTDQELADLGAYLASLTTQPAAGR
ncbi:MAG: c-type cytochrome [Planctomycetaceae bacterium]|nr:c-type cytochrome [Planctomycetaceae bacterium]